MFAQWSDRIQLLATELRQCCRILCVHLLEQRAGSPLVQQDPADQEDLPEEQRLASPTTACVTVLKCASTPCVTVQ